jgi:predicted dehydrogenase
MTQISKNGSSSSRIRFALVGAGGIAQAYVQAFDGSKCCELAAIADTRTDSAVALAEIAGCKSYSDYKQLADLELDAVIVATPPASHPEISCFFMERGVAVLCEKPLCLSVPDAERMIQTAAANNVLFTMASKFRYCDDIIKAKAILASGVLGDVLQFENAFTAKVDMSRRWNSDAAISGGGVLIDNGTHSVDIIRYFLGPIDSVLAVEAGGTQDLSVDENVRMLTKSRSGVMASVDLAWGINKELPYFVSIYGTNGTLHVGWRESKYRLNSSPDWTVIGSGYEKVATFKAKIENFSRALRGKDDLYIKPDDALASVQVIEAAYKSLNQKLWQPVAEKALAVK